MDEDENDLVSRDEFAKYMLAKYKGKYTYSPLLPSRSLGSPEEDEPKEGASSILLPVRASGTKGHAHPSSCPRLEEKNHVARKDATTISKGKLVYAQFRHVVQPLLEYTFSKTVTLVAQLSQGREALVSSSC